MDSPKTVAAATARGSIICGCQRLNYLERSNVSGTYHEPQLHVDATCAIGSVNVLAVWIILKPLQIFRLDLYYFRGFNGGEVSRAAGAVSAWVGGAIFFRTR